MVETVESFFTVIAVVFEIIGAIAMVGGFVVAVVLSVRALGRRESPRAAYLVLRNTLGAAILLGLEILVAADLIRTITSKPSIEGVLPWRKALLTSGAQVLGDAVARDRAASVAASAAPAETDV